MEFGCERRLRDSSQSSLKASTPSCLSKSYTLSVTVGIETFSFLRLSSKKKGQTESDTQTCSLNTCCVAHR